jgi:hypothetical protein
MESGHKPICVQVQCIYEEIVKKQGLKGREVACTVYYVDHYSLTLETCDNQR